MKEQLEDILSSKQELKERLFNSRNFIGKLIVVSLLEHANIKRIIKSHYREEKELIKYAVKVEKQIKKELKEEEGALLLNLIFAKLEQAKFYEITNKMINHMCNDYESKAKIKALKNLETGYYLCSTHEDCAEDHKSWQGKVYYKGSATKHGLVSLDYIVSSPVYLFTRPNCRHYFKKISEEELESNSIEELIKKYNMSSHVGNELTRTKYSGLEQRFKYHKELYKVLKSSLLKSAIEKDRYLLYNKGT